MPLNLQPVLVSARVMLRPFVLADASDVQVLAGNIKVAEQTMNIPYPYEEGAAESWISSLGEKWADRERADFAVIRKGADDLIGAVSFVEIEGSEAELGYWIGVPFWGQGYCSEAAKLLLDYGLNEMSITKITARHVSSNPASGRVLLKLGMISLESEYRHDRNGERVRFEFYETPGV